jgi:hypothetical protein
MSMTDKILSCGRDDLLAVTLAAFELLSKLAKLPSDAKFEMCHADFNELAKALSKIARSEPAPGRLPVDQVPPEARASAMLFANMWKQLSRREDDILELVIGNDQFDIHVAVAKNAIPEDVRRRMKAHLN